jgi:cell division protease FtsH
MGGYNKARQILEDNIDLLHGVAKLLLEKETIDGREIDLLMGNEPEPAPESDTKVNVITDEEATV